MEDPFLEPREFEDDNLLNLTNPPPVRERSDTDSYEDEWDDEEEEDYDEYDTEEEEEEEEEDGDDEETVDEEEEENEQEGDKEEEEEDSGGNKTFKGLGVIEINRTNDNSQLSEESKPKTEVGENELQDDKYINRALDITYNDMLDTETESRKQKQDEMPEAFERKTIHQDTVSFKVKEKIKRHMKYEFSRDNNELLEVSLKPGIPFRNTDQEREVAKYNQMEKPIIDEDDFLSEEEDPESIGGPYPEELIPVPEIGSERWKALMEQIMYKNPYEGYVPEETKEPVEMIWDRFERLDYQEGRYVDEDMFEDPYGPLDEGPITMEEIKELIERIKRGDGPAPYNFDKR